MAKSFFRNVTDQITGNNGKTTDTQIIQGITHHETEYEKLSKFKREFHKYTQAILVFDNSSYRFFDFIRSFTDSSWTEEPILAQLCIDLGRIRSEHLNHLHKQITSHINSTFNYFETMKVDIDDQRRLQNDYDRLRKQYKASFKRDEQSKIDHIQRQLDQLKSALNIASNVLHDKFPRFQQDVKGQYEKMILDLLDLHGNCSKNISKVCLRCTKKFRRTDNINRNNDSSETNPTIMTSQPINDSDRKPSKCTPLSKIKQTDYQILYRVKALYDYKAENDDEINLIKNEYLSVISFYNEADNERDDGWEYGAKPDGTIGLFPSSFTIRIHENE